MSTASSRILLLGWNEVLQPQPATAPPLRALVQQLAPLTNLAVLLPHEPQPAFAVAGGTVRTTGLAELDLAAIRAAARPSPNPAAWQAPAAPYLGSSSPAAPYLGATPAAATAPAAPALAAAAAGQRAGEPAGPGPAAATASARTPADGDFPALGAQPKRVEPTQADPLPVSRAAELPPAKDQSGLAAPATPATALSPAPPTRVHATLAQELAALGRNPPDATATDLNFQVIQYARFASNWACGKQFAVIYAVDWPTWLAAMEIRQLTGWPLVLHVHSLAQERASPAETGWAVALERLALRRADLVLAASAEVASRLTERYQVPPERLRTVAISNTAAINELLFHIEHHRPGRPAVAPITPPSA
ncbi:glycosyltransferase [Hymenobacter actinosclerus]|uniref:Glycosyl transferase 4-like domain-containing protein n=1 Tax=Hymenobacter actinosclerus TaxID=82805 RepID=A0A1I0GJ69_9BACT|nr:glycosyltransferase [Hymenobacter actinosclerus]SET70976.1 Glycosyl transferase 4-like domain-containing protein [Hymenobacter actinosclerus]